MGRATPGRSVRRWLRVTCLIALGLTQAGCYCADWRWIWENDDDYCRCSYAPPVVAVPVADPGR